MDNSPKRKPGNVPFQTITRNRCNALKAKESLPAVATVKGAINKRSIDGIGKNSSPSKKKRSRSPVGIQDDSVQNDLSNTLTLPSTSGLLNSSSKKGLPKSSKSKKTFTATVNKKEKKKVKTPKSRVSCYSPEKVSRGSKECRSCIMKQEDINILQTKIETLKGNEKCLQDKLSRFHDYGLAHLQREEEHFFSMKKKSGLQNKLLELEEEFHNDEKSEEDQIKLLICKKKALQRILNEKKEELDKKDAEDEQEIKKLNEKLKSSKESEENLKVGLEDLKKEYDVLRAKLLEEREKFRLRPKEVPVEEPIRGPCEICIKLRSERRALKNEISDAELKIPVITEELQKLVVQAFNEGCDIKRLSYEIEYLKKRIYNERKLRSEDDDDVDNALYSDFQDRIDFTEKFCNMLMKYFTTKKYDLMPTSVIPLPRCDWEQEIHQSQEENEKMDISVCCRKYTRAICRRFFCRRYGLKRTHEEQVKYETTDQIALYKPGLLLTDEGKDRYTKHLVNLMLTGCPLKKLKILTT